jgi:hypothetical protein
VTVRLLIFSGRPDPEWAPDEEGLATLKRHVQESIGRERAHPPSIGGLGYRGFLIESRDPEISPNLLVFQRVITVNPGPKAEYWRDSSGLEGWLLSEAERRDYGEVLRAVGIRSGSEGDRPATAT